MDLEKKLIFTLNNMLRDIIISSKLNHVDFSPTINDYQKHLDRVISGNVRPVFGREYYVDARTGERILDDLALPDGIHYREQSGFKILNEWFVSELLHQFDNPGLREKWFFEPPTIFLPFANPNFSFYNANSRSARVASRKQIDNYLKKYGGNEKHFIGLRSTSHKNKNKLMKLYIHNAYLVHGLSALAEVEYYEKKYGMPEEIYISAKYSESIAKFIIDKYKDKYKVETDVLVPKCVKDNCRQVGGTCWFISTMTFIANAQDYLSAYISYLDGVKMVEKATLIRDIIDFANEVTACSKDKQSVMEQLCRHIPSSVQQSLKKYNALTKALKGIKDIQKEIFTENRESMGFWKVPEDEDGYLLGGRPNLLLSSIFINFEVENIESIPGFDGSLKKKLYSNDKEYHTLDGPAPDSALLDSTIPAKNLTKEQIIFMEGPRRYAKRRATGLTDVLKIRMVSRRTGLNKLETEKDIEKNKPFKHIHDILINELNKIVANKEFYIIGGIINVNFVNETGQPKTNPDGTEIGHAMSWNWCEQDNIRKGHAHLLYGTKYSLNNEDLKITICDSNGTCENSKNVDNIMEIYRRGYEGYTLNVTSLNVVTMDASIIKLAQAEPEFMASRNAVLPEDDDEDQHPDARPAPAPKLEIPFEDDW